MIQLGVNIDHIATLRQARYRGQGNRSAEPSPLFAAHEAQLGGADGITVHLREDRRHMQDADVEALCSQVGVKMNLEMAATDEMVSIACRLTPDTAMLVPEGRAELTTEGGLDVQGQESRLVDVVSRLHDAGLVVSAFVDAEPAQIGACARVGFDVCEVHTGPYAHAFAEAGGDFRRPALRAELDRVAEAGGLIRDAAMRFNAGHALNYANVQPIAALAGISELHIGHSIVSRSVYTGLRKAVAQMKRLMLESTQH